MQDFDELIPTRRGVYRFGLARFISSPVEIDTLPPAPALSARTTDGNIKSNLFFDYVVFRLFTDELHT